MLRCTVASLIPLMLSDQYSEKADELYADNKSLFEGIIGHDSYYLLRKLPKSLARDLLEPVLPELIAKQKKNGMWKAKDSERVTYDIVSALVYIGLNPETDLNYNPMETLSKNYSFYSLLIKRLIYKKLSKTDISELHKQITKIKKEQAEDGSWDETVIGTCTAIENLLALGADQSESAIWRGVDYLFTQFNQEIEGLHTAGPYGLTAHHMFVTLDRNHEFKCAQQLKPEWIPRKPCFHTLAIIPNAICLTLLVRMGYENETRVSAALGNIYELYTKWGGLCATNIKKPFM